MVNVLNFSDVFSMVYSLYQKLVQSASVLWVFFSTPIDPSIADFFGIPADTMYIELLFGSILVSVLVGSVVKWFLPI